MPTFRYAPSARPSFGTRREIKNLNSFRFMQQAIDYEVQWQIATLEDGGRIEQATVLFDPVSGETRAMRSKEDAHDYRYFPDPDLLPLVIDRPWVEQIRAQLPELPTAERERLIRRPRALRLRRQTPDQFARTGRYYEATVAMRPARQTPRLRQLGHGRPGRPPQQGRPRYRRIAGLAQNNSAAWSRASATARSPPISPARCSILCGTARAVRPTRSLPARACSRSPTAARWKR
jgi:hypothetical protein